MTHLKCRDIDNMSGEAREARLIELREELLQLRAQQALGGSASNLGAYKATRRSIARLLTKMNGNEE
ncbi:MAG TPA: 50S ribosomal protein L29 [Candidatus Poseidoniales archaeon]|jgi:ribosomal protein L29|nr:50S ribosomal protein L29 [Candidatus Poseidoniales archaeon]